MSRIDYNVITATSPDLLEKVFSLREEVFVVEQKVRKEDEFDEFENESIHFLILDDEQNPIGAARWRTTDKGIKLERFAVKKNWRGKGVGIALVDAVLKSIEDKAGTGNNLYMHAQLDAIPLYEKFGFEKSGDLFLECGIAHYEMEKIN